jgi:hypothetical protein
MFTKDAILSGFGIDGLEEMTPVVPVQLLNEVQPLLNCNDAAAAVSNFVQSAYDRFGFGPVASLLESYN